MTLLASYSIIDIIVGHYATIDILTASRKPFCMCSHTRSIVLIVERFAMRAASGLQGVGDGIIMPLYPPHFRAGLNFVRSMCSLATDLDNVTVAFVLSSHEDEKLWVSMLGEVLRAMPCCNGLRWRATHWEKMQMHRDGRAGPIVEECASSKFGIQAAKKLYALLYFSFRRALVLDAESKLVKPLSPSRDLFDGFWKAPSFWYSTRQPQVDLRVVYTTASAMLGFIDPWEDFFNASLRHRAVFHALGTPAYAYFQDVSHWFYDQKLVSMLASQLEQRWGTLSTALCGNSNSTPWKMYESQLFFAFAYNSTSRDGRCAVLEAHPCFYDVDVMLDAAGLTELHSSERSEP